MSTFDENAHPREKRGGRFAKRHNDAPSGELGHAGNLSNEPLNVTVLPEPDPAGGFDTLVEAPTGRHYLRQGVQHREDGPAYEGRDGSEKWIRDGQLHRDPEEGPALIEDGYEEFYEAGVLVATR